jgi:2-C-methyl-D-erythritol 2,4-cyclodiphosphate synthase
VFKFKTGFGFDVHRLTAGRKLILGGVEIPHDKGLDGHSDADVMLHALCDSLLGAAGFSDIGNQFPNTDDTYKNISSLHLLKETFKLLKDEGWKVGNADITVVLEEPKINKFSGEMKKNISEIIETDDISIKATTSEGLGFVGSKDGCTAYASVLIYRD